MFVWILIATLIAIFVGYSLLINRVRGLPPGPPPWPIIGNLYALFSDDLDRLILGWKKRYGKIFTIWIPMPVVIYADHQVLNEHIIRDGDNYGNRRIQEEMMKTLLDGNYGLAFMDNSIWKEQRSFALKALRNLGVGTADIQDIVIDFGQEAIRRWKDMGDEPIDVRPNIMAASANIVWQITFGRTLHFDDPQLVHVREVLQVVFQYFVHPVIMFLEYFPGLRKIDFLFGSPITKLKNANDKLLIVIENEIREIQKNFNPDEPPKCFIEAFLGEIRDREKNGVDLSYFTLHQAKMAAWDLWGAGFETISNTYRYGLHYLINHPEVQRKMQEEIDKHIGTRIVRYDDQKLLPYCSAFIQEVQRLANQFPLNFMRQTSRDTVVEGHKIVAGTAVIPQFPTIHIDPEEFDRPYLFSPERHLDDNGEFLKDARINPFSVGKRACIGENLARMEVFIFLVASVQHLTFSSVTKIPPKLEFVEGFLRSPQPFFVRARKRID